MDRSIRYSQTRSGLFYKLERSADLDPLLERIADARIVLLGEASHGTHEYYTWRSAITRRLISEKKFNIIAVEGDWPDCYKINRYIKGFADAGRKAIKVLSEFRRWPTWMWANWEIISLVEWLRSFNQGKNIEQKIGFYGLDVYSLWESIEVIHNYVRKYDPKAASLVENVLECFEPYNEGHQYAKSLSLMSAGCADEVTKMLSGIRQRSISYDHDLEAPLNTRMNALVVANAEAYYRSMIEPSDNSWNIRDEHMVSTLNALMDFHGEQSKVVVWEHNTHVGDARYTDMKNDGLWNVGQLVREQHQGKGVYIVGFAGYEGSVIAARHWGAKMLKMPVPPAEEDSIEHRLHTISNEDKMILFDHPSTMRTFNEWMRHRAIGVVYHPEYEKGNYVPSLLPYRYDALLYFDQTTALHPLHIKPDGHLVPQTYPFNF